MRYTAYLWARGVWLVLVILLLFTTALSAAPTVNGLFYGDGDNGTYDLLYEMPNGDWSVYYYQDGAILYIAIVINDAINDNVFDAGQTDYKKSVNWNPPHKASSLIKSDHIQVNLTCGANSYSWQQDYCYESNGTWYSDVSGPDGTGSVPPGCNSASSLQWNLNNSPWVSTFTGTEDDWKSPFHPDSPNSLTTPYELGYPQWDSSNQWEWAMVYEMSFSVSPCSDSWLLETCCIHNSPAKTGEESVCYELTDFGDLPAPYLTLEADNGPSHIILTNNNPTLGSKVDPDINGHPEAAARGDDNDNQDDEDGVLFDALIAPSFSSSATVQVSNTSGYLNAWIDFDNSGTFESGEQVATDMYLTPGSHKISFTPPADAVIGYTFARFRFSTNTGLDANGPATDGEVEDHRVEIISLQYVDFGDAATELGWPQAGEAVDMSRAYMGATVDAEGVYTGSLLADADDGNNTTDDEDGVIFYQDYDDDGLWVQKNDNLFVRGYDYKAAVTVNLGAGESAVLTAWFDFYSDGVTFSVEPGEVIIDNDYYQSGMSKASSLGKSLQTAAISREYIFTVPDVATADFTYVRFRLDTNTEGPLSPSGYGAGYGEVEDYYATLDDTPPVAIELTSFEAVATDGGIHLDWSFENTQEIAGFNVLRSDTESGPFKQINKTIIPVLPLESSHNFNYIDNQVELNQTYYYKLQVLDLNGKFELYGPVHALATTGIDQNTIKDFKLCDNYPNPFNSGTWFEYHLPMAQFVEMSIYNIRGERVKTLISGFQPEGAYSVKWDATDQSGRQVSTGTFIYHFNSGSYEKTGYMLYLK